MFAQTTADTGFNGPTTSNVEWKVLIVDDTTSTNSIFGPSTEWIETINQPPPPSMPQIREEEKKKCKEGWKVPRISIQRFPVCRVPIRDISGRGWK